MNHETNEKPILEKPSWREVMEYVVFQQNVFH